MANGVPDTSQYGRLDRLLHRVAFQYPAVQSMLTHLEDDMYARRLTAVKLAHPVFITGLPRAGTTLMLELLQGTDEFASYTYRHMPFVLSPLLWQRLTAGWQQQGSMRERAHGDGLHISHDSPEAFEEILWQRAMSDHFSSHECTRPVAAADLSEEFVRTFRQQAKKLVLQRRLQQEASHARNGESRDVAAHMPRYLSKNNANVARLPALQTLCPNASTLVCFRHPASHVASLHTQHRRFTRLHQTDRFASDYMRWSGHFDLGANFRPIRIGKPLPENPDSESFWLHYWVRTYEHVLSSSGPGVQFVSLDALLAQPQRLLPALAEAVCLAEPQKLISQAATLRSPNSQALELHALDPELACRAESLYEAMTDRAIRERSLAGTSLPSGLPGDDPIGLPPDRLIVNG